VREQCPLVRTILQVGGSPNNSTTDFYSALEGIEANATFNSIRQDWHAPALTYFTSGTSGPPKMVRHNQISYPLGEPINGEYYIVL
jgi:medium-chain acyl-CoA synthetase